MTAGTFLNTNFDFLFIVEKERGSFVSFNEFISSRSFSFRLSIVSWRLTSL